MKSQSIVFAIVGVFFGFIVGWILGSQQASLNRPVAAAAPVQQASGSAQQPAKTVDEGQVRALQEAVSRDPNNAQPRVELGNLYYDADRFGEAAKFYEEALKLQPADANVSTDLGLSYYYLNQPDRALQQFDNSLRIDPKHVKTYLNQGFVRAFGKQDLEGAASSWQKVIELAPDSPEGQRAKQMLDGLKSAHPGAGAAGAANPRGGQ